MLTSSQAAAVTRLFDCGFSTGDIRAMTDYALADIKSVLHVKSDDERRALSLAKRLRLADARREKRKQERLASERQRMQQIKLRQEVTCLLAEGYSRELVAANFGEGVVRAVERGAEV